MRRLIELVGIVTLLCTSFKCYHESDTNHCFIHFANRSEKAIYIEEIENYPDTVSLIEYRFWPTEYNLVEPYKISKYLCNTSYEAYFCKYDTLMIFVFEAEKVEAGVSPKEAVIARYDVSLEDLQCNNWLLSYPPNSNMAHIKMWPPYSSY